VARRDPAERAWVPAAAALAIRRGDPDDLEALLAAYAPGPDARARLLALARDLAGAGG